VVKSHSFFIIDYRQHRAQARGLFKRVVLLVPEYTPRLIREPMISCIRGIIDAGWEKLEMLRVIKPDDLDRAESNVPI
jgi:hypothetical protein